MASRLLLTLLPPEIRLNIYKYILMRLEQPVQLRISRPAEQEFRTAILRTCRQIYNEGYPVLLSANTWEIRPAREHHTWLFGLGLQGQNALRKITLKSSDTKIRASVESFYFEICNTLSSFERLELTINASTLQLLCHYKGGTMKYLHGFANATMGELSNESKSGGQHGQPPGLWTMDLVAQRNKTWKILLDQLMSACPEDCEMHVGRPASHTKSTVHLSLVSSCFDCEQLLLWNGGTVVT